MAILAQVWTTHFEHVLEAVLRCLQNADEKLRELGMACTKDMLRAQPQRFRAFTEHVLLRMLAAANDDARAVALGAEEALELLLSISDTHRCMGVLVPVIAKEGPPTLQLAIRLQSKLIGRFSQLQLLSILPQVLPPLFEAFKNQNADVRKAVVFCLVDMYMVRTTRPRLSKSRRPTHRPSPPLTQPSLDTTGARRAADAAPRRALDVAAQARHDLHQPHHQGARRPARAALIYGGWRSCRFISVSRCSWRRGGNRV